MNHIQDAEKEIQDWIYKGEIGPHDLGRITGRIIREWEDNVIQQIIDSYEQQETDCKK